MYSNLLTYFSFPPSICISNIISYLVILEPGSEPEDGRLEEPLRLPPEEPRLGDELGAAVDGEAGVQGAQLLEDQHPALGQPGEGRK